jgi:hypothetical protein
MNRNILSLSRPAWLSPSSGPRSSLRHDFRSRSIRAALDVKSKDGDPKPSIPVATHDFHHTAINDAYGMICHGSVPLHCKSEASEKVNEIFIDNSTKRDVLGSVIDADTMANGTVLKVAAILY